MPVRLALAVLSIGLLAVPPASASTDSASDAAARAKGKAKCKKGKVALTVNGRRRCVSLRAALPRPRAGDPALLAAHAALSFDPGRIRDRRGRRAVSVAKLLGAKRIRTTEGAIRQGLLTLDRLKAKEAFSTASASALATASARGCAAQAQNPSQTAEFKGSGYEAKIDVGKGAAEIGIDLGGGGVRAEVDFGLCEKNDDVFKAPDCPDAEGHLEASDRSDYFVNMRIFKGSELLLSQNLELSASTTIRPIQVDQDARIEYFEIEHTYKNSIELGGSSQSFGRVGLRFSYHGSTRVNYPGATYDPTHTDVEVKLDVDGVEADQLHEVRDIEFDQSLAAKSEADKNFAAAVDKAIAKLAQKEEYWNTPNKCVEVSFEPLSDTLTLERDQGGGFKAEVRSKSSGRPAGAKWTLTESTNATVTPPRALANPASFGYVVTNAGKGIKVRSAFRAVSQAGVGEGAWIQPTKVPPPPPPPPAPAFAGSISGTATYDAAELGAGNQLSGEWSGNVKLTQEAPLGETVTFYGYKLTSGLVTYTFEGSLFDCHVEGAGPIDLGAQIDLTSGTSLILLEGSPRPFHYQFVLPMPLFAKVPGVKSGCDDPEDDGDGFDLIPALGVPALVNAPTAAGQVLAEDESLSGVGSGDTGPGSPDQTWKWALAPVP